MMRKEGRKGRKGECKRGAGCKSITSVRLQASVVQLPLKSVEHSTDGEGVSDKE